nr:PAS domain S-box protein [uncultured Methanospirillum sp.]
MISVLLVDDEPVLLDIGRMFLEKLDDFQIHVAQSGREALSKLQAGEYDAVVSDYEMPNMSGIMLLREVRSSWPDLPFILFTGRGREEIVIEALNSGADFYLQKGGDPRAQFTELAHKIKKAVSTRSASTKLRESEATFRQFFESAGEAIFILDHDRIVDSNQRGITLLGRDRETVISTAPSQISTPVQPDGLTAKDLFELNIFRALSGEIPVFEWQFTRPDGSIIDTAVTMSQIDIHGHTLLQAIVRDISARKREEKSRMLNEIRLEAMIGLYAIRDKSLKEITDFALESAVTITESQYGYLAFVSDDEYTLTMYSWSERTINDCRVSEKPLSYQVKNTGLWGEAVRQRQPVITNDYASGAADRKGVLPIDIPLKRHMNIPVFDGDNIVMVAGVANKFEEYNDEDVRQLSLLMNGMWGIVRRKNTEEILQKKNYELAAAYEQIRITEDELKMSEGRYRGLVERSEDLIIMLDARFIPIYISPSFYEMTGYDISQVLGKPLRMEVFSKADQEKISRMQEEVSDGKPLTHFEIQIRCRDGGYVSLDMRGVPIYHDGQYNGIQIIGRDISAYKEVHKALMQKNHRLQLLSDLTRHDILNKLTTLGGFLDIVSDEDVNETNIANTICQAQNAVDGIKYLIEFTRDYQSLGIRESEWIDAGTAFYQAAAQLPLDGITTENLVSGISVRTDPLFSRALYNLMENSIRHGGHVSCIRMYARHEGSSLTLILQDNGVGILPDEKERIFLQGVGHNTGLGLFLVHEILTSTGLTISETGVPGKGARFEIHIPAGLFRTQTHCPS